MGRGASTDPKTSAARSAGASSRAPRCCYETEDGRRTCSRAEYERLDGKPYCSVHGAELRATALDKLMQGETPARRWHGLSQSQQQAYQDVLRDPALLDPRGPLALHRVLLNEVLLPSDELVFRTAYSIAVSDWEIEAPDTAWEHCKVGGELLQMRPSREDVKAHHIEQARGKLHRAAIRALRDYQEATNDAAKLGKVEDLVFLKVHPIMQKLGMAFARGIEEHVRDKALGEKLKAVLDHATTSIIADLMMLAEEAKR